MKRNDEWKKAHTHNLKKKKKKKTALKRRKIAMISSNEMFLPLSLSFFGFYFMPQCIFLRVFCFHFRHTTKTFVGPFYATQCILLLRLLLFKLEQGLPLNLYYTHTHTYASTQTVQCKLQRHAAGTLLAGWAHLWFSKWLLFKAGFIHKITMRLIMKPDMVADFFFPQWLNWIFFFK